MDYEKKYKDALEKAKSMIDDLRKGEDILAVSNLESLFPELKESEDERIRKEIIRVLKGEISFTSEKENEKYIAWLEKQAPKPKWSENDGHRLKDTIYFLDTAKKHYASIVELDACIDWLKSIKQRMGGEE